MHPFRRGARIGLALACALVGVTTPLAAQQAPYTITGRVVETGSSRPLERVSVLLVGTQLGTLTNQAGEFTLRAQVAPGNHTLQFSHLGHARRTLPLTLGAEREVAVGTVELSAAAVQLNEVVVTGTGAAAEKRQLGNTVTTVGGEEVNEAPAAQSIDKALQGKVLGALISQNNGQPGGGVSIRLRGTGSILGGAEPLIVIDGVIVENSSEALVGLGANATYSGAALTNSLSDIAPGDIERVEVVKGAAAAALYGSRANNGVIQIFTKRGRQGAPAVTYRIEASVGRAPGEFDLNYSPTAGQGDVFFGLATTRGAPITRYNYHDQIFQQSQSVTNQLSVTGGTGGTSYYASALWQNEDGIVRSTGLNNVNTRATVTQQLGERLTFTVGGNYIQRRSNFVPEGEQGQGVITTLIFTPTSWNPAYDEVAGRYPYSPILGTNPLDVIANWNAESNVGRFIGNLNATWTPLSAVTVNYTFGFDRGDEQFVYYQPIASTSAGFLGQVQAPARTVRRYNNDLTATHAGAFGSWLTTTTTLGFRQTANWMNEVRASALGLAPGQKTVGAGGATPSASESIVELRTLGGFLEERLGIADRLFLTGGVNYEGSSSFGADERWQLFPRIGASWNLDREPFFAESPLAGALSTLRLRAAYGQSGGQPPSPYSIFANFLVDRRAGRPALIPGTDAGNPDLKPERQREYEAGLDAAFLNDRASLEFTWYDKLSNDLVLNVPLPLSSGFARQLQNIGAISNKGIELALNALVVNAGPVQWNSRVQYAANRSRVEKLVTSADTLIFGYLNAVAEGMPVGEFYGWYYPRDEAGNIVYAGQFVGSSCTPVAGTVGIIPSRARGQVGTNPCGLLKKFLGSPEPKFTLSWNNDFDVGERTNVSLLLDGRFGNKVANFSRRIAGRFGASADNVDEQCLNTGAAQPVCQVFGSNDRRDIYEEFIEDGSFVKLREVALRYTLDQAFIRRLGTQRVTLMLAGRNLHTWTDYTGIDPEVNLFSANTVARGVEFGTSPIPRTLTFGATFDF